MKGCRPLSDNEVERVMNSIQGPNTERIAALFIIGVRTGFRISELLSVRIKDLIFNGKVAQSLRVERRHMKGGKKGKAKRVVASTREVPLNPDTHPAILEQWQALVHKQGLCAPDTFFFQSRMRGNVAISRWQAWKDLTTAYAACGLEGKIATHGMRKTFARVALDIYKDCWKQGEEIPIQKLQKALGHASIVSTQSYAEFADQSYREAFTRPRLTQTQG